MSLPITLSSGLTLVNDDFYRGLGCMAGIIPTHEITPAFKVDDASIGNALAWLENSGGFGFAVTRYSKPPLFSYQRGIDGVTHSPWGHALMIIGENIGRAARLAKPSLLVPVPSQRWKNVAPGHPVPMIGGIPRKPAKFEVVESKAFVSVTQLEESLNEGTQTIIFTNPAWTREQKIAMAVEAYSWIGEPYDIFEIAHWVMPLVPNPAALKACSTLALKIIAAGDPYIKQWCVLHGLDPELVAPRDIFAYGVDMNYPAMGVGCTVADAIAVKA